MLRIRDLSTHMVNHWPMRNIIAKSLSKADTITLPDYAGQRFSA